ncbi:hypothetical protein OPKNFCMD_2276 [Methylobacterium crusticola]|uniref:Uncharacterized protein n=1 Tax=Methylobacterium crusticola TaxID=1697972 RepID=A0ABQ4QW05_9HYPH|nr:hypothetical protein [Methylobacterium crusticola]GJD49545.1 hypothetical protein OPKNFCMD_2276 [Methylobacterium crusticola]
MSPRLLSLLALLCVADAITVNGRAPRAIQIAYPEAGEPTRLNRPHRPPRA